MNSKIDLWKNSSNEYFKTILHYLCVYSLSGFTVGRSINGLVFFAAFAEVQVTVLSVLNHDKDFQPPVQSGTVVFATPGYLPQKYFAICQRTINRG